MRSHTLLFLAAGFNLCGGTRAATQAVSREITTFTSAAFTGPPATQAISREVTSFTLPSATPPTATQAVSREIVAFRSYQAVNVVSALRIAAGLSTPTALDMEYLNLNTDGPSATVIDILDAAAVATRAAHPESTS